jgi:hypothetical protein
MIQSQQQPHRQCVTTDEVTFTARLVLEIRKLLSPDFNWNKYGIFVAGGFLSGLMEPNYDPHLYQESDIDMYVCGQTMKQLRKRVRKVLHYLRETFKDVYFIIGGGLNVLLIDCVIKKLNHKLQIIGLCDDRDILHVIQQFDLTHCQIAYDGTDVIYTPEFVDAMRTKVTKINPNVHSIHAYRLVKSYLRGYSVELPKHNVYIKNFFRQGYSSATEDTTRTNRIWHTHNMGTEFDQMLVDPIVQQNLHKNPPIDFSLNEETMVKKIVESYGWSENLYIFSRKGQLIYSKPEIHDTLKICDALSYISLSNVLTR